MITMHYELAKSRADRRRCYELRHQIYCVEKRWLPPENNSCLEFDRYDAKAKHIMALDGNALVGYLRIIPGPDLPIFNHPGLAEIPHGAEISRLMFLPGYRVWESWIKGLFRAAYQHSRAQGIRRWYVVAERSLLRAMRNQGFEFVCIGQPAEYFGAETVPAALDLAAAEKRIRRTDPDLYEWFTKES